MHFVTVSPGTLTAFVVALSFAAGLNTYLTVFALGVMARMHWVVLPPGLETVADGWVLVASGILFAGGFVLDKIPGLDVVWNALHTFLRIPMAGLLAYAASEHLPLGAQMLVTVLGAGVAAVAHGSKTAARVAVTASPEPFSNVALSTAEDGAAVGLTWVAMHHPLVAGGVAGGLVVVGLAGAWWLAGRLRDGWHGMRARWQGLARPAI